jgi:hypothetical protein
MTTRGATGDSERSQRHRRSEGGAVDSRHPRQLDAPVAGPSHSAPTFDHRMLSERPARRRCA